MILFLIKAIQSKLAKEKTLTASINDFVPVTVKSPIVEVMSLSKDQKKLKVKQDGYLHQIGLYHPLTNQFIAHSPELTFNSLEEFCKDNLETYREIYSIDRSGITTQSNLQIFPFWDLDNESIAWSKEEIFNGQPVRILQQVFMVKTFAVTAHLETQISIKDGKLNINLVPQSEVS